MDVYYQKLWLKQAAKASRKLNKKLDDIRIIQEAWNIINNEYVKYLREKDYHE